MRVVVIGAGLAGLSAAGELARSGHEVVVLDKGRSVGGRTATRRIGGAVLDHGAQFFTVRSDELAAIVDPLRRDGLVFEWSRGFGTVDGYPRYAVRGGMTGLAKHLALGLDVRCSVMAFTVRPAEAGWQVLDDTGAVLPADAVVVTTPVLQALALCVEVRSELPSELLAIDYDPTLALLLVVDGPSAVPEPGGRQDPDDVFSFVADNARKGISAVPALTLHANAAVSRRQWDAPADVARAELLAAAQPYIGNASVLEAQLKRWRFATPTTVWPQRCCAVEVDGRPLVLAGDAYGGPKVEGAILSGLAAALCL